MSWTQKKINQDGLKEDLSSSLDVALLPFSYSGLICTYSLSGLYRSIFLFDFWHFAQCAIIFSVNVETTFLWVYGLSLLSTDLYEQLHGMCGKPSTSMANDPCRTNPCRFLLLLQSSFCILMFLSPVYSWSHHCVKDGWPFAPLPLYWQHVKGYHLHHFVFWSLFWQS
jgi:hypothetical protein